MDANTNTNSTPDISMEKWRLDAQHEGELAYREAIASGATIAEAARLSKKAYGRARGRAASAGSPSAIESEARWISVMMERREREAQERARQATA